MKDHSLSSKLPLIWKLGADGKTTVESFLSKADQGQCKEMEQLHLGRQGLGADENWNFRTALGTRLPCQMTRTAIACSWTFQCREIPHLGEAPTALATVSKGVLKQEATTFIQGHVSHNRKLKFLSHTIIMVYLNPEESHVNA